MLAEGRGHETEWIACFCIVRIFDKEDFPENLRILSCFVQVKGILFYLLCAFDLFQNSGSQLCLRLTGVKTQSFTSSSVVVWWLEAGCIHPRTNPLHLFLNRESCLGTTDDLTTSFLHFLGSPLPSGTLQSPGLFFPWCCLPCLLSSLPCLLPPPFTVPCKFVFLFFVFCLPDLMNGRHISFCPRSTRF